MTVKIAKIFTLSLSFFVILFESQAHDRFHSKVIYGEDNRVDVYASTNKLHTTLARSTAAQILNEKLIKDEKDENYFIIQGSSLQEEMNVCKSEPFSGQIVAAECSGFLVAEDLLVTAGHCMTGARSCTNYAWVFDFKENDPRHKNDPTIRVPISSVYACKEIVSQALNYQTSEDYALVRLERRVTDRSPLAYRKSGRIADGESILVIGHPSGLPTKIADRAIVRENIDDAFFVTNLDTYAGNSGSAVFNARTGVVEGILVRGDSDYLWSSKLKDDVDGGPTPNCRVSNRCSEDGCKGEEVSRITTVIGLYPNNTNH